MADNTITVRASGRCVRCTQLTWADVPADGQPGTVATVFADVTCPRPGCDARFAVTWNGVIPTGGR